MSLQKVQLRKLLKLFYLDKKELVSALRKEIRSDINRSEDDESGGGDFFGPFWGDAKKFTSGQIDIRDATANRINRNRKRRRLYQLLLEGFLKWWNEKRRWRNEPFTLADKSPSGLLQLKGTDLTIRVENILALNGGDNSKRAIYPYFSEDPALSKEAARIGLWVLGQSISDYAIEDIRILDILRSTSFSVDDCPFEGNEEELFVQNFHRIKNEWQKLRNE